MIRNEMARLCRDHVGIAVSKPHLETILKEYVSRLQGSRYGSRGLPVKGHNAAIVTIIAKVPTLRFREWPLPGSGAKEQIIEFSDLELKVSIIARELDLQIVEVAEPGEIPSKGMFLLIIAKVGSDLHFRIFDSKGKKVIDDSESKIPPERQHTLAELKQRLKSILDPSKLTPAEKLDIVASAKSALLYTIPTNDPVVEYGSFLLKVAVIRVIVSVLPGSKTPISLVLRSATDGVPENETRSENVIRERFGKIDDYSVFFTFVKFQVINEGPRLFVSGVQFPNLLDSLESIQMDSPIDVVYSSDYLILKSKEYRIREDAKACPILDSDIKVVVPPSVVNPDGESWEIRPKIRQSRFAGSPVGPWGSPDPQFNPIMVLYVPEQIQRRIIDVQLSPSFPVGDSGYFLMVDYGYEGVIRVDPPISGTIQANHIRVDTNWKIATNGYAGITIACITYSAPVAKLEGDIRDLNFTLNVVFADGRIRFSAQASAPNVDVTIRSIPFFPWDIIASLVLDGFATRKCRNVIAKMINRLNMRLWNLSDLLPLPKNTMIKFGFFRVFPGFFHCSQIESPA